MMSHHWYRYSRQLVEHILSPMHVGVLREEGKPPWMRIIESKGEGVCFYLGIDETDGTVVEAKFQAFAKSALVGASDLLCDTILYLHYSQLSSISPELLDRKLRENEEVAAFPDEVANVLEIVLTALELAVRQCEGLPSFIPPSHCVEEGQVEREVSEVQWESLSDEEQVELIRQVIAREISPYVEMDGGGVEVLSLKEGREVMIAYHGACVHCPAATDSTLAAIQQTLRAQLHSGLIVTPDFSFLADDH